MCLLSYAPAHVRWNPEHLKTALKSNPHGWGFMGKTASGDMLVAHGMTEAEMLLALPSFQDLEACFHARYATHGLKTVNQCHPYKVLGDLHMAHNGIFNIPTPDPSKSDTWHMARRLGSLGPDGLTELLTNDTKLAEYSKAVGCNKIVFMSPTIETIIVNADLGHYVDGVWMSNNAYKPHVWDKGGITTFTPKKVTSIVKTGYDMHPVDMLDSWLEAEKPWALIRADIEQSAPTASLAVEMLVKRLKDLEESTEYDLTAY